MINAQSAVEYLTTYVWALILISVAAVILFFFSGYGNAPPSGIGGSCIVFRPNGPNTLPVFLQGACNGAEPKYVAGLLSPTASISTPLAFVSNTIATTVSAWVKINETSGDHPIISSTWTLAENSSKIWFYACTGGGFASGSSFSAGSVQNNTWTHVVVTLKPTTPPNENVTIYINGVEAKSNTTISGLPIGNNYQIGGSVTCGTGQFNGYIANMQIYNAALSPGQVRALFLEGIGGNPISITNLQAWYQLNGDATDYSGNGENATAAISGFTQSWISGYVSPEVGLTTVTQSTTTTTSTSTTTSSTSTSTTTSTTTSSTTTSTTSIPVPITLASGQAHPIGIAVYSGNVYWTDAGYSVFTGTIDSVPIGGGSITTLANSQDNPTGIAVYNGNVYWTNQDNPGTIESVPIGGGSNTVLASGQNLPFGIAIYNGNVYWTDRGSSGAIDSVPITGGSVTVLTSGQAGPTGITVSNSNVFWTDQGTPGNVMECAIASCTPILLATGRSAPQSIITYGSEVYWIDSGSSGSLAYVPIGGGSVTTLAQGLYFYGIATDGTNIYWTNSTNTGMIYSIPIAGGSVTVLASGQNSPGNIAVDATNVYWVDDVGTIEQMVK